MATATSSSSLLWRPRHDSQEVDIVFVTDCTGSMASYIYEVQRRVSYMARTISGIASDIRLALVEYRDHPPEEETFLTRVHDFTRSVAEMQGWADVMSACGGGDEPEAVADGLEAALNLSYRGSATKICVLIVGAPPHGLNPDNGDRFPEGCPSGHDPVRTCHEMAARGIILYCVACEPSLSVYRDFYMGLSHITGGQYTGLFQARNLPKVIVNAVREEVENERLMGHVGDHLHLTIQEDDSVSLDELANTLHQVLRLNNTRTTRLQRGGQDMEPVSNLGRQVSFTRSLAEVRVLLQGMFQELQPQRPVQFNETFEMTALDEVTPRQCERLVRRSLSRSGRTPVEQDDEMHDV